MDEETLKKVIKYGRIIIGVFLAGVASLAWFTSPIYDIREKMAIYETEIKNNSSNIVELKEADKALVNADRALSDKLYELKSK